MQVFAASVAEEEDVRIEREPSLRSPIAAPTQRSSPPRPPEPEPSWLPEEEPEPTPPFWTWFIENPRRDCGA